MFHEPFVLFGYLAALTTLELVTGVIILPQRQTALVAKQAAEVDLLTGGRFRLGVGVGWNAVEYEASARTSPIAAGASRADRAHAPAVDQDSVTYNGSYETVTGAGLCPLPIQRPIPVWFGAMSPPAYRRVGPAGRRVVPAGAAGPEARRGQSGGRPMPRWKRAATRRRSAWRAG